MARTKTTVITELWYPYTDKLLLIVDVSGQRALRRKWITCFDNVNAVIFVAAMSEYDQKMWEDENK
ncbi:G-protein alpha subunit, partial [Aphelenchoides avenae]